LPSLGGWHVLERGLKVLDELGSEPRVSNAIGGSRDLNHHDDDQPLLRIDKKRRAGRTCSNEMTELIRASEGPVIDTSCTALLMLAREVHAQGYKVALTGEGADEWLAGYPWHKVNRALGYLDVFGVPISQGVRRFGVWASGARSKMKLERVIR